LFLVSEFREETPEPKARILQIFNPLNPVRVVFTCSELAELRKPACGEPVELPEACVFRLTPDGLSIMSLGVKGKMGDNPR
jgi:hypothetical protein